MGKIIIEAASYAELLALVQGMGGGNVGAVAHVTNVPSVGAVITLDDDESGDADAVPGSVDKNGLPWDERIHSTPAKLTGKGMWRAKRGVADGLVAAVEAELRARGGAPVTMVAGTPAMPDTAQPVMTLQPQTQTMPVTMAQQPVQMQPVMQTPAPMVMQPQQQPVQMQPVAPVQQQQPMDFSMFMQHLSKGFTVAGADGQALINQHYMAQLAAHFQLSAITDLSQRPDLIPNVVAQVQADGRWIN